jgi:lipopolysaccharide/colanic/teichoic acid biosynthesis glycosyltransferase
MQVVRRQYIENKEAPLVKGLENVEVIAFIERNLYGTDPIRKAVLSVDNKFSIENLPEHSELNPFYSSIVNLKRVNDIFQLTQFFCAVNNKLEKRGRFITCVETSSLRKERLYKKYPKGINSIYYVFDYLGKRVAPKLPITKNVYQFLTANRNSVHTSVEVLGCLSYCGFQIIETKRIDKLLYISVEKIEEKVDLPPKNYGFLFKMERTGYQGKIINVYKIRSMHAYAEYLQEYIYSQNQLSDIGKFKNDYRINVIGKLSRKLWLDELPMIYNLLKGDIKLVGVRPLSKHFLSLYKTEIKDRRSQFKPGLVPPYYADMPKSLDQIMESEMRYFDAYQKNPLKTDVIYFLKAAKNILIKKARSK